MTKILFYGCVALSVLALFVSWLIFPSDNEIANLQYRDKLYSSALSSFESEIKNGDYSARVVLPLTDLYLQYGQIEKAIALMETFVETRPNDVEALERLGLYYQYIQRYDDYSSNLEKIYKIKPSADILRRLSDIYNQNEDYSNQRRALEQIVSLFDATKKDVIDLAYLYAGKKQYLVAVKTLREFSRKSEKPDPDIVELMISLLIDAGRPREAFDLARSAVEEGSDADRKMYVLSFHSRDQPKLAYQLIQDGISEENLSPDVLSELTVLEIKLNQSDKAYKRLDTLHKQNKLPDNLKEIYLSLLVQRRDTRPIPSLVQSMSLERIKPSIVTDLIYIARETDNFKIFDLLHSKLSTRYRNKFPIIDMRLRMARGDKDIKSRANEIRKIRWLTDQSRIQLAKIYLDSGYKTEAMDILTDLERLAGYENFGAYDTATLFIDTGLAAKGIKLANDEAQEKTLSRENRYQLDIMIVLMAIAANDQNRVLEFLARKDDVDTAILTDIFFLSKANHQPGLTLAASERLLRQDKTGRKEYVGYHAEALLENGRDVEALEYIKQLSEDGNKSWIYLYSDTLKKTGRLNDWRDLWISKIFGEEWGEEEKRSVAFALLENGYEREAESVFSYLSTSATPDSPDVDQLIAIWRQRPSPDNLDWLESRMTSANEKQREKWFASHYDLASRLNSAESTEKLIERYPELIVIATRLDVQNGEQKRAYNRMRRLRLSNSLPESSRESLLEMAFDADELPLARELLVELSKDPASDFGEISGFAKILPSLSREEIAITRRDLGEAFLIERPVIAVMLDVADARVTDEPRIATTIDNASLSEEEQIVISGFLLHYELESAALRILVKVADWTALSADDLPKITQAFLSSGRPADGLELFRRQRKNLSDRADLSDERLDHIELSLLAAAGHDEEVIEYISTKPVPSWLLTDLYYVSMDFGRAKLAKECSTILYQSEPSHETLAMRARALIAIRDYENAAREVEILYGENPGEWDAVYIDLLEKLGDTRRMMAFWTSELNQPDTTDIEKREIAFNLLSKGFKKEAEKVFMELAENTSPDDPPTQQLLYLWGAMPGQYALDWIKKQLDSAESQNKAGWLRILERVGQEEAVITYVQQNQYQLDNDGMDVYLKILVAKEDKSQFKFVARRILATENSFDRLKKLARWSSWLGIHQTTIAFYQKAFDINPNDQEILNEYAKNLYYSGEIETAGNLFKRFFENGGIDYVSFYLYGEILWQKKETSRAKEYYRTAEEQLSFMFEKSVPDRWIEARIKSRLGEFDDAIRIYKDLITNEDQNLDIKADYVETLIESGRLAEAEAVLSDEY